MGKLMRSKAFVIPGSDDMASGFAMTHTFCWIDWEKASAYPICTNFINRGAFSAGDAVQHINYFLFCVEIPLEGDLRLIQRGQSTLISPGKVGLIHQNEDCRLETGPSGFCRKLAIGFTGTVLPLIVSQTGLAGQVSSDIRNFETLYAVFDRIEKLIRQKSEAVHPEICALSLQFLMELATQIQPVYPKKLMQALALMHSRVGTSLTLENLARELHIGKSTLERLFRFHLNQSPKEYYRSLKFEKAKQLLFNSTLSVKEIADLCGYRDQFNFTAGFRRSFGVSPRELRKRGNRFG